jgi:hypothetical protein
MRSSSSREVKYKLLSGPEISAQFEYRKLQVIFPRGVEAVKDHGGSTVNLNIFNNYLRTSKFQLHVN